MRILLYSGKGGVGKTSVAAATGVQLARLGHETLVMSVDPAHSLADAFALKAGLFDPRTADPCPVRERLHVQEVNIQIELKRHWHEIAGYLTTVLRTSGLGDVEAEELAILPGMEELSALMYVNQYRKQGRFDVIVLDCAPTAGSLRFIAMPTTLDLQAIAPDPLAVTVAQRPYSFERRNGVQQVRVAMPFAAKGEVGLFKKGDELVIEIGVLRRHVGLQPLRATFEGTTVE
jgi:arsenite/tail-anchored protein-transporting ATPase